LNFKVCTTDNDSGGSSGGSSGTAFFVSNKGHLLTNNHVVDGCEVSKITYQDKDYDTQLLATDKTLDLALLKADLRNKSYLNFSGDDAKKMQKIYVGGYPLGKGLSDDLKISSGIVSSLKGFEDNSNEIQIDAAINPGNSGGPIINEDGELVAIAVSGLAKDKTEGINFGIKASAAERFLKSNDLKANLSFFPSSKKNEELLEILEGATVYTYCN
jgi:serine protease Do